MNIFKKMALLYSAKKSRKEIKKGDDARDAKIGEITGVSSVCNIRYSSFPGKYGLADVHFPEGSEGLLPTIIVVHGGGWYYGTKETYYLYGRYLAKQGFAVLVYSYPLAPENPYPRQLLALDEACEWLLKEGEKYHLDKNRVLLFGDSAGGHLALHYTEICVNPLLKAMMKVPFACPLVIKGIGLNCASFRDLNLKNEITEMLQTALKEDVSLDPKRFLSKELPPIYMITGDNDFLKDDNIAMDEQMKKEGITHKFKLYVGETSPLDHVFPCNMALKEAREATKDEIEYLMPYLQ